MSIGPGYACARCQEMLRPRKNEIYVQVNADSPYQVWMADLWECPNCGTQTIAGYGQQPLSTRHEPDFEKWLARVTHIVDGKLKALT